MPTSRSAAQRVVDRVLDRRPSGRAALRRTDQERNVLPTACVKSGSPTDHAVRQRAVASAHADGWVAAIGQTATALVFRARRRPVFMTALPVSAGSWRTWQSRLRLSVVVSMAGLACIAIGTLRGVAGLIVLGSLLIASGWLNRVRALHNAWVGLEYRPDSGEIVVTRVHSAFAGQARALYTAGVIRDSKRR